MRKQKSADYRDYRMEGIRMTEELAPELVHGREQDEQAALYAFHMYDKAHAVMLAEQGIMPRAIGAAILASLRDLEREPGGAVEARARIGGGMHSGEHHLIRVLGEDVGGWDHRRSAHQICGLLFRLCDERSIDAPSITGALLDEAPSTISAGPSACPPKPFSERWIPPTSLHPGTTSGAPRRRNANVNA